MLQSARVLLVEDSATDAELLSAYLAKSKLNLAVTVIRDGQSAVELLSNVQTEQRPDLVLLDLNLPKLGGFEVLRAVKTDPGLKPIPVVILTASVLEEDVERAYHLQADAYLTKPLDSAGFKDVVAAVERLLATAAGE